MSFRWRVRLLVVILFFMPICTSVAQTTGAGSHTPPKITFHPIPVLNYVAVDISSAATSGAIAAVALDDNNNAAFTFTTGSFTLGVDESGSPSTQFADFDTCTWQNGSLTGGSELPGLEDQGVANGVSEWWIRISPPTVTTAGNLYGIEGKTLVYNGVVSGDDGIGLFAVFPGQSGDMTLPDPPYKSVANAGFFGASNNGNAIGSTGKGTTLDTPNGDVDKFDFIRFANGNYTVFDQVSYAGVTVPSTVTVDTVDNISFNAGNQPQVSNQGWIIGYDNDHIHPTTHGHELSSL